MQVVETSEVRRVVVGVGGSPESVEAARFAGEEAAVRGLELLVVDACEPVAHQSLAETATAEASIRAAGQALVDAVLSHARVATTTRSMLQRARGPLVVVSASPQTARAVVPGQVSTPRSPPEPSADQTT